MKVPFLPLVFTSLLGAALAVGPGNQDHPSDASAVVAGYTPLAMRASEPQQDPRSAGARVRAAQAFLDSLDEGQPKKCSFTLDGPQRRDWTNVPPGRSEPGLKLGDLTAEQIHRALDLLASSLSPAGYAKARDVMLADDRLLRNGKPRTGFGTAEFWILLFGVPSETETWGLQFDGHHLAYNLTFKGDRVCMSPSFLGTQPARYSRGSDEVVPLRHEVDRAFALMESLSEAQRFKAAVGPRRGRIETGPGRDGFIPDAVGLPCAELSEAQRELLVALLESYVGHLPASDSSRRMARLTSEVDRMHFAWSGPVENPGDVSYHLQGPSILLEYACQDIGGDPLNHLHAMYRDPTNEYGAGH